MNITNIIIILIIVLIIIFLPLLILGCVVQSELGAWGRAAVELP